MKNIVKLGALFSVIALSMASSSAFAATSPDLGMADSFTILSSTYINTVSRTTLNGDLGYTTPPAVIPMVNGTIHSADSVYNQAGIDQGIALAALNSQPCTFNFAPGAIDLATDTTHGVVGVYTPGVYCMTGASNAVVGGTITLTGGGTYIFRMDGALTTAANSIVVLAGGASACDVWWTPGAATTLGANSTFIGTNIDASGITIGSLVTWTGKALAFGGTVTTDRDTITTSACTVTSAIATPAIATPAIATPKVSIPGLPKTGLNQPETNYPLPALIVSLLSISSILYVIRKNIISSSKQSK